MRILIISHTPHYKDASGIIKGWGPTVREINFLATKFEEVVHIGCLHEGAPPESSLSYTSSNIKFTPIPPSGGKGIADKLQSIFLIPTVIKKVNQALRNIDAVQLRVPTGMANYLLPWFTIKNVKQLIWVKYAGNWNQTNAPIGYRFQKWWLSNKFLNCKVTINGSWKDQPEHCFTFENPCLTEEEREDGKRFVENKIFLPPYTACFIGRIETEKGVGRIINALSQFKNKNISTIHFIGDGSERKVFEKQTALQNQVVCIFHGSVDRNLIPSILEKSHFLLLPSTASEGFPKVIGEGANYGAIPIVSNVSSIGQYVNNENGFIWDTDKDFNQWLHIQKWNEESLKSKSRMCFNMAESFTFESYYRKLKSLILNDN